MKIVKEIFLYVITLLIIIDYGIFLYVLKKNGDLTPPDFINNITIFVGWIVALLIAWIHLQKTRKDNQLLKKEEIKQALEVSAFREINEGINGFSFALSITASTYCTLPDKLKFHMKYPLIFKFDKTEIGLELSKEDTVLHSKQVKFLLPIEANEIVVIEYNHYKKYIQFRIEDAHNLMRKYINYFGKEPLNTLITKEGYEEFEKRCYQVYESLMDIQAYLFDYRIELMNSTLAEIFDKKVPERNPRDNRYKTLKEVAIKKQVEKESEERDLRAMRKI